MAVRNSDSVLRFRKRRPTDAQPSANGALVMRRKGATLAFAIMDASSKASTMPVGSVLRRSKV
ncbi:hypothetical protein ASE82_13355 [Sphingomonas sp. Leaf230]|nr:hypothetical protein ASE82_13355 [Sphingomonas sp. Leaf230]